MGISSIRIARRLVIAAALALVTWNVPTGAVRADQPAVGTALVLLVDVSGSIDDDEYALQRQGIAQAFRDPAVVRAIWNQPYGAMAITIIEWSSTQVIVLPWVIVNDAGSAEAFASTASTIKRSSSGGTYIGDALVFALAAFDSCPCTPSRRVIDISGDGASNGGRIGVEHARDTAVEAGVTINGLPIRDPTEANVVDHYREHVIGGMGSFVAEANGFADFARALRHKLVLEIADASRWR